MELPLVPCGTRGPGVRNFFLYENILALDFKCGKVRMIKKN